MSKDMTLNQMIDIAIDIEKKGAKFYTDLAKKVKDVNVSTVIQHLADEEARHASSFAEIKAEYDKNEPVMNSDLFDDLEFLVKKEVLFGSGSPGSNELIYYKDSDEIDLKSTIDFAIGVEKDSIVLYSGLTELLEGDACDGMKKILNEERRHLQKLVEMVY